MEKVENVTKILDKRLKLLLDYVDESDLNEHTRGLLCACTGDDEYMITPTETFLRSRSYHERFVQERSMWPRLRCKIVRNVLERQPEMRDIWYARHMHDLTFYGKPRNRDWNAIYDEYHGDFEEVSAFATRGNWAYEACENCPVHPKETKAIKPINLVKHVLTNRCVYYAEDELKESEGEPDLSRRHTLETWLKNIRRVLASADVHMIDSYRTWSENELEGLNFAHYTVQDRIRQGRALGIDVMAVMQDEHDSRSGLNAEKNAERVMKILPELRQREEVRRKEQIVNDSFSMFPETMSSRLYDRAIKMGGCICCGTTTTSDLTAMDLFTHILEKGCNKRLEAHCGGKESEVERAWLCNFAVMCAILGVRYDVAYDGASVEEIVRTIKGGKSWDEKKLEHGFGTGYMNYDAHYKALSVDKSGREANKMYDIQSTAMMSSSYTPISLSRAGSMSSGMYHFGDARESVETSKVDDVYKQVWSLESEVDRSMTIGKLSEDEVKILLGETCEDEESDDSDDVFLISLKGRRFLFNIEKVDIIELVNQENKVSSGEPTPPEDSN